MPPVRDAFDAVDGGAHDLGEAAPRPVGAVQILERCPETGGLGWQKRQAGLADLAGRTSALLPIDRWTN